VQRRSPLQAPLLILETAHTNNTTLISPNCSHSALGSQGCVTLVGIMPTGGRVVCVGRGRVTRLAGRLASAGGPSSLGQRWEMARHTMRCGGGGSDGGGGGVSGGVWNASAQTLVQRACSLLPHFVAVQGGPKHDGRVVSCSLCSLSRMGALSGRQQQRRWKRRQCRRTHVVASADPMLFLPIRRSRLAHAGQPGGMGRLPARDRPCFTVEMTRGCRFVLSARQMGRGVKGAMGRGAAGGSVVW
jgi:hypothetical protein